MGIIQTLSRPIRRPLYSGGGGGGTPTITSKTGTFTQGGTLTLSGSGFSANRNGQVRFLNFSDGTVGQPLSGTNITNSDYNYSNSTPFSSGGQFIRADWSYIQPGGAIITMAADMHEILVDYWVRINIVDLGGTTDQQIKLARIVGGRIDDHTASPTMLPIWQMSNSNQPDQVAEYLGGSGVSPNDWFSAVTPSQNVWQRATLYYKRNTLINGTDGMRFYRTSWNPTSGYTYSGFPGGEFAAPSGGVDKRLFIGTNLTTWATGDNFDYIGQLFLPFYERDTMHSIVDVANVSINDSLERVEFGDANTWLGCTPSKRVLQPMTARSTTDISVACEIGPLTSGTVYAYAFNTDGTCNATGFQVSP
jgi:hypothetical protein